MPKSDARQLEEYSTKELIAVFKGAKTSLDEAKHEIKRLANRTEVQENTILSLEQELLNQETVTKAQFETIKKLEQDILAKDEQLYQASLNRSKDTSAVDKQIGGDHYKQLGHYQPWEIFAATNSSEAFKGYMVDTAISYLMRNKNNSREDIEKAIHTLQGYLELSIPESCKKVTGEEELEFMLNPDILRDDD